MRSTRTHFLDDVHDIPLDRVGRDDRLSAALARLPGRRFVFTNGDAPYARRVLDRDRGRRRSSTTSTTSTPAATGPSPIRMAMNCCASASGSTRPTRCWPTTWSQNLAPAKALGMTTIWVDNGSELGSHDHDEAHYRRAHHQPRRLARADYGDSPMTDALQREIDAAWEARDSDRRATPAARCARRSRRRSTCSIRARRGLPSRRRAAAGRSTNG